MISEDLEALLGKYSHPSPAAPNNVHLYNKVTKIRRC